MPELPEVETVRSVLDKRLKNKIIKKVEVFYPKIFEDQDISYIKDTLKDKVIYKVLRYGKWLMFDLNDYYLLSHLRMEGKYLHKDLASSYDKHELVSFILDDELLVYKDVRKFGKMHLIKKEEAFDVKPLNSLGLEPFANELTTAYLKDKFNRNIAIKTLLLDQSIVVGIGNIYADEILFEAKIFPLKKGKDLNEVEIEKIISATKKVLRKAIENKGTTIRSYTFDNSIKGNNQQFLNVHTMKVCKVCNSDITKEKVGGRSTYYCKRCQKN